MSSLFASSTILPKYRTIILELICFTTLKSWAINIKAILDTLNEKARKNIPHEIKMAMPWYKPERNIIGIEPDYFIHKTDDWLVFPHEMDGLTEEEIFENKEGMKDILSEVKK